MRKRPAPPIAWDVVSYALVGALLGTFAGGLWCCYCVVTDPKHDFVFHVLADPVLAAVLGGLLVGALAMTRNWIAFR